MSTVIVLTATGLGLGALYFLIASGLSLIFGLMRVLNFAHGAILAVGAYLGWWVATLVGGSSGARMAVAVVVGVLAG
ncbi:MAG: ABC transporter permease subunit, partial [Nocardioidaceae bacterium]